MIRRNFLKIGAGTTVLGSMPAIALAGSEQLSQHLTSENPGDTYPYLLKLKESSNVHSHWIKRKIANFSSLPDFKETAIKLNQYGGRADKKYKSTGFFRTEKIEGSWQMIDPDGNLFFAIGAAAIDVPDDKSEKVSDFLWDTGFNMIGCWSDYEKLRDVKKPMPCSIYLDFIKSFKDSKPKKRSHGWGWKRRYRNMTIPVFHPEFEEFAHKKAEQWVKKYKDDPYLIGYYTDNELPFPFDALDRYLEMPASDHGHLAAKAWFKNEKGKEGLSELTHEDRKDFLYFLTERYYRICNEALGKHDPNHLNLGSRLHGYEISLLDNQTLEAVLKASGKYVDVVSINLYGTLGPSMAELNRFSAVAGAPIMITEFYAKGMDSGKDNNNGAGRIVPDQSARGDYYQNFTLGLLQSGVCVGWDLYRYIDHNDSNKGLVNSNHEPYKVYRDKVMEIHKNKYILSDYFNKKQQSPSLEILKKEGSFILYRKGLPFEMKGQIGLKNPERLIDAGGNAVKIYGDYSFDLAYLEQKKLAALFNIDFMDYAEASKKADFKRLEGEEKKILEIIKKHKNNDSIIFWGLGDNVEFDLEAADMKVFWKNLNSLIGKVKNIDPDRPLITSISANHIQYLADISVLLPEIDVIGINAFDPDRFESIPGNIIKYNWTKPYVVTEYQFNNDFDILEAPFDVPYWVEGDRLTAMEKIYQDVVVRHPQCLGAFILI